MRSSLQERVQSIRVQFTPEGDPDNLALLAELLFQLYAIFGDIHALGESIFIHRRLLPAVQPSSHSSLINSCLLDLQDSLGEALSSRYADLGDDVDISEAKSLHEGSLRERKALGLDTFPSLYGLGFVHYVRAVRSRSLDSFQDAIKYLQLALKASTSHPRRTRAFCFLVLSLAEPIMRQHDLAITRAFEVLHLVPQTHPDYILCCIAVSRAVTSTLWFTYPDHDGHVAQLIRDTCHVAHAINHPYHPLASISLTRLTLTQSLLFSDDTILNASLAQLRSVYVQLSYQHSLYKAVVMALSWALNHAYGVTGRLELLDENVTVNRALLGQAPQTNRPSRPLLHNLSIALHDRYKIGGRMQDLEEALCLSRMCTAPVASTPHIGELYYLEGLGSLLISSYRHIGCRRELDAAVELHRRCLTVVTSLTWQDALRTLDKSVEAFRLLYEADGDASGILGIIPTLRKVLVDARASSSRHDFGLRALAVCLRLQGAFSRDIEPVREAILVQNEALSLLSPEDPLRSDYLENLALCHLCAWKLTRESNDLDISMNSFSDAANNRFASPQTRMRHALKWCSVAVGSTALFNAYRDAIALLPRVVLSGGNAQERLYALKQASNLSVSAAMHALKCSSPSVSVELLEQGRAIFWTYTLNPSDKVDQLPFSLRERLLQVSRALETCSGPSGELSLARRQQLLDEFDTLVDDARETTGCNLFLQPLSSSLLLSAAAKGPIAVLLAGTSSASAILVNQDVQCISLPGVDNAFLQKLAAELRGENYRSRAVSKAHAQSRKLVWSTRRGPSVNHHAILAMLWTTVVKPTLTALSFNKRTNENCTRPRLFWCPTGSFTFLPLHAAGIYKKDSTECASDYCISSYTPTISALINASRHCPEKSLHDSSASALCVAVPDVPGYGALPYAAQEVDHIHALLPSSTVLKGDITLEQLTVELSSKRFLHLACHGRQDTNEPLNSGFVFHDGVLTLSALMELKVPHACLAFLSACESATGDPNIPDETIHLAAAMLFIGFRSVIGTMWSMDDIDGPFIAERVYKELLKDKNKFDYETVPRALDAAVRELREKGVHPSRWATWIHLGT